MAYGSVLSDVSSFCLSTADGITQEIKNNPITRVALRLFGIPHIGLRLRAGIISKFLDIKKDDIVLDAGCGIGLYLLTLSGRFLRGYGVDVDTSKINEATRLARELSIGNITFSSADAVCLDFSEGFFDKIICSEVMEHVQDDRKLIKCFFRMLKKGGTLVVSTTSLLESNQEHREKFSHARTGYSLEQLRDLFTSNGFYIEQVLPYGLYFGQMAWKMNRRLLTNQLLNTLSFYPLMLIAFLDRFLSYRADGNCIGYIVRFKK